MHGKSRIQRQSYERKRGYGKSRNRTGSAEFKEETSLNNGTQLITAPPALTVHDTETPNQNSRGRNRANSGFQTWSYRSRYVKLWAQRCRSPLERGPVVGGNVGGILLQIIDGANGFLTNTVEDAAEKTLYLLRHPEEAKKWVKEVESTCWKTFLLQGICFTVVV